LAAEKGCEYVTGSLRELAMIQGLFNDFRSTRL
jgi:hypothetical protein